MANNILGNEVALSKPAIRHRMVFAFGGDVAASLGINIKHIRVILLGFTALIAADIVTNAGAIRFIDLVIPHRAECTDTLFASPPHSVAFCCRVPP